MDETRRLLDELMGAGRCVPLVLVAPAVISDPAITDADASCRNGEPLPEKRRYVPPNLLEPYIDGLLHAMQSHACAPTAAYLRWVSVTHRFEDKDVCHYYLAGMCPYEEFERTKHDVGPCPLVHDDELKADFAVGGRLIAIMLPACKIASCLHA